ncbi:MAG: hypothetical protein LAN61_04840 [Acidobacteriia bacterium]|nr:hypothetical protein [Terriglobia bacterium]
MSILETQLADLKAQPGCADAEVQLVPDGSAIITIPNVTLPTGWSKSATTIRFVAPVGYPHAKPDCFWADTDLRLQSNAMPQATNITPIPGTDLSNLWFSWHTMHWDPNRDSLTTYLNVVRQRFKEPK